MLKRILTLSLSVIMLTSLCPTTSVFAADTKPAAFTENFEDGTRDEKIVDLTSGKTMTADVADGVGKGGGKAIRITSLNDTASIGFKESYAYQTDFMTMSYDIKVNAAPTTGSQNVGIALAGTPSSGVTPLLYLWRDGSGDNAFTFSSAKDNDLCNVIIGKWYKIIVVHQYNQGAVWVLDDTGAVVASHSRTGLSDRTDSILLRGTTNAMNGGGEILIDNIEYNKYATTFGPSLVSDTIADSDIPRDTKSVTVTFDQPIDVFNATLTPKDGVSINCNMEAATDANGKVLPFTYEVSWTALPLTSNTEYTLDLTASIARHGTSGNSYNVDSTGKIIFTTLYDGAVHLWETPIISAVDTNSTDANKTDISFKLIDNPEYANTTFKGAVMAVLYTVTKDETGNVTSREMTAFDIVSRAEDNPFAVNDGKDENGVETNTESFSLGALPANRYEIWLIQMDTASGLTPLAFGKYPVE